MEIQTDEDALRTLRSENQLLTLQARVLRSRLRDAEASDRRRLEQEAEELGARIRELEGELHLLRTTKKVLDPDEYNELWEARGQLRWLVGRLGSSFVGPLLRTRPGWRTLEARWR